MGIEAQGKAGNLGPIQDGTVSDLRLGREADLIVSEFAGKYGEATRRGEVFTLNLTATTTGVAAGNINAAAAAASTQFALWNPVGNTKAIEILKVFVGVISGTVPAGPLFHNLMLAGVPSIASSGSAFCNLAGSGQPTARFVASAGGATLTGGGALTVFRPMLIDFTATAYASAAGSPITEVLDGDIVLPPGTGWVPCWVSAGTSVLNAYGLTWRECPWP